MAEWEKLAEQLADPELIRYFYLTFAPKELVHHIDELQLSLTESQDMVPFNAQVKGYFGALDSEGDPWIVKPVTDPKELLYHRLCTLAYVLDHWMGTLAAPTTVFKIKGSYYRATKVIQKAMQISSYNYLEQPFIGILRADLINRWWFFDEDRNPNNYLVIHNAKNKPFICAIDYDKADLASTEMKITGNPEKFGWFRKEKTRFLTLLRPDHFEGLSIESFEERLQAMMSIPEPELYEIALQLFIGYTEKPEEMAMQIKKNMVERRNYINSYFRSMFKTASETKSTSHDDDYSMLGASFMAMHRDKK